VQEFVDVPAVDYEVLELLSHGVVGAALGLER